MPNECDYMSKQQAQEEAERMAHRLGPGWSAGWLTYLAEDLDAWIPKATHEPTGVIVSRHVGVINIGSFDPEKVSYSASVNFHTHHLHGSGETPEEAVRLLQLDLINTIAKMSDTLKQVTVSDLVGRERREKIDEAS